MNKNACVIVLVACFLSGCAAVELSGKMTRLTGEIMTDYANTHTGIIAKGAGFGGKVNTAVGRTVEGIAQKGEDDAGGSKGKQFIDANKQVMDAAIGSVSVKNDKTVPEAKP